MGQVLPPEEVAGYCRTAQARGAKVVFTNGCFDLLHPGHVYSLEQARRLGDLLVVGLNSDASVRRLKGPGRPFVPEAGRSKMLCALNCVDYVCVFEEDTPEKLINSISPNILVKGADYSNKAVVGADGVKKSGGSVVFVDQLPGYSTTALIEKIAAAYRKE